MIIDFFITMIIGAINLLPSFDVGLNQYLSPIYTFLNAINTLNYYLPIQETFVIFNVLLGYYLFKGAYKAIQWIIQVLPLT